MSRSLAASVTALSAASRRRGWSPWSDLDWPEAVAPDEWCMSPELVSLHGTAEWDALDDAGRTALARSEAVGFFSLNVHGERLLMEGVARRLHQPHLASLAPYLHHFLEEENRHCAAFAMFCDRYGAGVYPDRKVPLAGARPVTEADFLFFAQVLVFEEIVDAQNVTIATDDRVVGIARQINARHHADESRHLAFGRAVVADLADRGDFDEAARADLADHLTQFLAACWGEYANPACYRAAGSPDPRAWRQAAWDSPAFRRRRAELSAGPVAYLRQLGLPVEAPA